MYDRQIILVGAPWVWVSHTSWIVKTCNQIQVCSFLALSISANEFVYETRTWHDPVCFFLAIVSNIRKDKRMNVCVGDGESVSFILHHISTLILYAWICVFCGYRIKFGIYEIQCNNTSSFDDTDAILQFCLSFCVWAYIFIYWVCCCLLFCSYLSCVSEREKRMRWILRINLWAQLIAIHCRSITLPTTKCCSYTMFYIRFSKSKNQHNHHHAIYVCA